MTDDSALNISVASHGDFLKRLNSKSMLESSYKQAVDDDYNIFGSNTKKFIKPPSRLAPVMVPEIGITKAKVSLQTLNLMKKRL